MLADILIHKVLVQTAAMFYVLIPHPYVGTNNSLVLHSRVSRINLRQWDFEYA